MQIRQFQIDIRQFNSKTPEVILLEPLPQPQVQKGGTCGYYAMSIVTSYWHANEAKFPFVYARKSDYPSDISARDGGLRSLRQIGKSKVPTLDGIFDAFLFNDVLSEVGYESCVYNFETLFDFSIIVTKALSAGFPLIFTS